MKVVNLAERWIGYRSNDRWETIGPRRTLPVHIPQNVEEF